MPFQLSWPTVVASLYAVYCVVSYIFRRYPLRCICINKTSKLLSNSEIIAHRGGCNEVPENTLSAIKHATKYANICEIDIQFTKDNVAVLFHDKDFNRLIQCYDDEYNKDKNSISHLNWNEVMKLRIKNSTLYTQDTFYSKMKHRSSVSGKWGNNECIPRLEDVLKYLTGNECNKQMPLILDMQKAGNNTQNLNNCVGLILKYKYEDKVILFEANCKEHEMETIMPMYTSIYMMLLYLLGLLPFISFQKHSIVAICSSAMMQNYLPFPILWLYNHWILTPKFINHLKGRGFKVIFMTVDVGSEMKHSFHYMGFNAILTDCPQMLMQYS